MYHFVRVTSLELSRELTQREWFLEVDFFCNTFLGKANNWLEFERLHLQQWHKQIHSEWD